MLQPACCSHSSPCSVPEPGASASSSPASAPAPSTSCTWCCTTPTPAQLPPAVSAPVLCLDTSFLNPSAGVSAPSTVPNAASTSAITPTLGGLPALSSLHGTIIASLTGPGFTSLLTFFSTAASTSFLSSTTLAAVHSNSRCSFLLPFASFPHRAHVAITFLSASVR